jgi:hypothetical protein
MTRKVRKRKGKNSDKHWVGTECLGSVFNHLLSIKLEIFLLLFINAIQYLMSVEW